MSDTDSSDSESNSNGEDRNPSPPRELLDAGDDIQNADKIGDTVFSKQWVCQTLMKLIQDVEKKQSETDCDDSNAGCDVADDLQNELCELWDMSTNQDVANFLQEYKAVDILAAIISKSKAPRATEICVGILGNLACKEEICREMTEKEGFIELILFVVENPDAPTLVETTRLIFACLSSADDISKLWTDAILKTECVYKSLIFIVSSSTNDDLLKNAGELIDKLLDVSDEMCRKWSTEELVAALLETLNQLGAESDKSALATYLHIFQLISTCENGVKALELHLEPVYRALCSYLKQICKEDEILGLGGREGSLAAVISVINVVITIPDRGYKLLADDEDLIRCLLKILEALYPRLRTERQSSRDQLQTQLSNDSGNHDNNGDVDGNHGNGANSSAKCSMDAPSVSSDQPTTTASVSQIGSDNLNPSHVTSDGDHVTPETDHVTSGLLFGLIQSTLMDTIEMMAANIDERGKPPSILTYISDYCPRARLHALLLCLNSQSMDEIEREGETNESQVGQSLTKTLLDVARTYELNRISETIKDFQAGRHNKSKSSTRSGRRV